MEKQIKRKSEANIIISIDAHYKGQIVPYNKLLKLAHEII